MDAGKRWIGLWIRKMRLERGWSQEGLCHGICAVSYLSKIERGEATASDEVLNALATKLDESWASNPESGEAERTAVERGYELFFYGSSTKELSSLLGDLEHLDSSRPSPFWLDRALLGSWFNCSPDASLAAFEKAMDERQHVLYLEICSRSAQALEERPCAATYFWAGADEFDHGRYAHAIELLREANARAAEVGAARLMLDARIYMGSCYSNLKDTAQMETHYRAAERLAKALGDESAQSVLRYNLAATALEMGRAEEAYAYFSALDEPNAIAAHKLAIACEKLGKREEALAAIERGEEAADSTVLPTPGLARAMLGLVRYRLEHEGYLNDPAYGTLLLETFEQIRRDLPQGFAEFHLPWVLEWHRAHRQYKEAMQLLLDFPSSRNF